MYVDTTVDEVQVYQSRLMEIHQSLAEIVTVLRNLGPGAAVSLQLNSFDVYLPRLEILALNSVAKAKTDALQHKYKVEYPERETKKAASPSAVKKAATKAERKAKPKKPQQ